MIGWLQGQVIEESQLPLKQGIILNCSGVGYEIQLLHRHLMLVDSNEKLTLWIHQITREDSENLYGFETIFERDLFRLLIGVSGVGAQIAMALLEEAQVEELVSAIVNEDINKLRQAQGVGKRTAERLSLELRHKLEKFNFVPAKTNSKRNPSQDFVPEPSINNELIRTLRTLGYEDFEIKKALQTVTKEVKGTSTSKSTGVTSFSDDPEALLKAALIWLSNHSS